LPDALIHEPVMRRLYCVSCPLGLLCLVLMPKRVKYCTICYGINFAIKEGIGTWEMGDLVPPIPVLSPEMSACMTCFEHIGCKIRNGP
jgi:hypothetical protein